MDPRSCPALATGRLSPKRSAGQHPITLRDAIAKYGRPSFCKVDVEGHERAVFATLAEPIPLIAFEGNLPAYLPQSIEIVQGLGKDYLFNFSVDFVVMLPGWGNATLVCHQLSEFGAGTVEILARWVGK